MDINYFTDTSAEVSPPLDINTALVNAIHEIKGESHNDHLTGQEVWTLVVRRTLPHTCPTWWEKHKDDPSTYTDPHILRETLENEGESEYQARWLLSHSPYSFPIDPTVGVEVTDSLPAGSSGTDQLTAHLLTLGAYLYNLTSVPDDYLPHECQGSSEDSVVPKQASHPYRDRACAGSTTGNKLDEQLKQLRVMLREASSQRESLQKGFTRLSQEGDQARQFSRLR
ncbi:hypothetical protein CI109_104535 [Kwoniella shandongensis]|uniref:Uncharacterized protein n=1 Tax=Kwoniella shandongensis TaxID=1734106 RepID=A0A5M6BVP2_9TREE|nr:uncharacterized protein CI109_005575 [Kwoniella shandongensis]KAA5526140.1 hypothetical protein CI109_005575 [Kwoniella shandongensis]